jgi:hypothetical protein
MGAVGSLCAQNVVVVSVFDGDSFEHAVTQGLRIRFRRALVLALVGVPLLVFGAWLLDSRGSPDQRQIQSVWDVIGGLAGGAGFCLAYAGGFMMWTALRWRWTIRRSPWVPSRVATLPTWFLGPDVRLLVALRDFHPDVVYSVAISTVGSRGRFEDATDVLVAGRCGSTLVVAAGPLALVTVRPPRTGWTRRRWLWRIAHPAEANLGPLRRLLGTRKNM